MKNLADGRTFITVSRSPGVPASLHTISNKFDNSSGPLLIPYPNWAAYKNPAACQGITSVYRITIDQCNRLWVLDDGKIGDEKICTAQLLVYDLKSDEVIFKIEIPDKIAQNEQGKSLLVKPVIEIIENRCNNVTAYIADMGGHGLIVWNNNRLTRFENKLFDPEPQNADITIAGETLHLLEGILGLALTPKEFFNGDRLLFFKSLASRSIYSVPVRELKSTNHQGRIQFYGSIDVLSSQATAMTFSSDGTLFYGLPEDTAIGCWNLKKPFESKNLVSAFCLIT
ncbi:hypothetical protein QAD02_023423 [Eretmocerus hayati]|uniref:Uncharacterized protein n=1 Tax=Eretmocerus hayati TaxID=131215 RepID=A0ACC2PWH7_9HYME|nr:hypothetical protein QAD02_023423 [Eretmocerus hayati]